MKDFPVFKCEILGINQFYLSSSFQIFQKFQASSNICVMKLIFWDGLSILWFATSISGKFKDCLLIWYVPKLTFFYGVMIVKQFY